MFKEFKEFAMRGNVIDMAVGIIIGAAFGKIVSSFVNDVIMPPLGLVIGNVDFSNLAKVLNGEYASLEAAVEAGAPILFYGRFIQTVLDFVIVAFAIFMAVKMMNKLKRQQEAAPPPAPAEPSAEVKLLTEIRDALKRD
jgi:large conductance mechanosensitive channel